MGYSRQEYWSGVPFLPPRDLPHPGIEQPSPVSLVLAGRFFTNEPPGDPFVAVVQSLSCVQLCVTLWTAAHLAFWSITNSWSLLKLMPFNHLILCHPLLLRPSIFPSIRVFSNESVLRIRWPKYWSFSFSLSSEYSGLISFRTGW